MTLLLLAKRQLKKPALRLILFLIPCFAFFMSHMAAKPDTGLSIALYAKEDDTFTQSLITKLTSEYNGMFTFYSLENKEAAYEDVATGRAECGYVFEKELLLNMDLGIKHHLVDVIVSPDSMLQSVTNEIVYSALFEQYSLHMLQNYFVENLPQIPVGSEMIASIYNDYLHDGSTFSFTYVNPPASSDFNVSKLPALHTQSFLLLPVKGIFLLLILLAGLTGGLSYYDDRDNHIYDVLSASSNTGCHTLRSVFTRKKEFHLAAIAIPALLCAVTGYLSTIIWLPYETLIIELFFFTLLFLAAVLLPLTFHLLFQNRYTYTAALLLMIPAGAVLLFIYH